MRTQCIAECGSHGHARALVPAPHASVCFCACWLHRGHALTMAFGAQHGVLFNPMITCSVPHVMHTPVHTWCMGVGPHTADTSFAPRREVGVRRVACLPKKDGLLHNVKRISGRVWSQLGAYHATQACPCDWPVTGVACRPCCVCSEHCRLPVIVLACVR